MRRLICWAATDEGRILSFLALNLGLPRVIAALNSGFVHSWGQGGYLAPATSGFAAPGCCTAHRCPSTRNETVTSNPNNPPFVTGQPHSHRYNCVPGRILKL